VTLLKALAEYELAAGGTPGTLLTHRTSSYDGAEMDGLREATKRM
jgi:hypothetical protein